MFKLLVAVMALGVSTSFGQLVLPSGFKKTKDDMYEMTFKDVRQAINQYNFVLDKNGVDTKDAVYDIMHNPIDFGWFKNDANSDQVIVSFFIRSEGKYKIIFTEIPDGSDKYFFDVLTSDGEFATLFYDSNE